MKILSVRKGFASDHSSTSYEFLAVDKPLSENAQAAVASLSSRACPTARRISFTYNAEGYDLPGGWHDLMLQHYDVMYSESYDRWILVMAFDASDELQQAVAEYEFEGIDENGIDIFTEGSRVVVAIYCRLELGMGYMDDYDEDYYEDDYDEEEDEIEDIEVNDPLLSLLVDIRQQLTQGDFRALYEVWNVYGWDEDDDEDDDDDQCAPPIPHEKGTGLETILELRGILVND